MTILLLKIAATFFLFTITVWGTVHITTQIAKDEQWNIPDWAYPVFGITILSLGSLGTYFTVAALLFWIWT